MNVRKELSVDNSSEGVSIQPALGIRLRARAQELGLKGAEVARRAGLSPRRYSNYVSGRREPDLRSLQRIGNALKTSVDALLDPTLAIAHRDGGTYSAMSQLNNALGDLLAKDIQFLADLATFVGSTRDNERRAAMGRALSPAMQRLARVHEDLIPLMIRRFPPGRLSTEMLRIEADRSVVQISMDFNEDPPPRGRASLLQDLAEQQLALPRKAIRVSESRTTNQVNISIDLGMPTTRGVR